MIKFIHKNIEITGISTAVPVTEKRTDDFTGQFGDENVQKFKKMTGVEKIHISKSEQTASDLGFIASKHLLEKKAADPSSIGALIFVTQTPDYKIPSTSCVIHKRLGLSKDCVVFDINLGCSGYVYGLQTICALMNSSNITRALLVAGDTLSKMVSPLDRSAVMLFGDAGTATLLEKTGKDSEITSALRTDGNGYRAIIQQAGSYRNPLSSSERTEWPDGNTRSDFDLYMNGTDVFNFTISEVPGLINDFMQSENKTSEDYDCLVMHQANLFILKQISKRTKFSTDKTAVSIDLFGNTSVASIPLTLSHIYGNETENIEKKLLLAGFGIGLSWGVVSVKMSTDSIFPIIYSDESYDDGGIKHD